MMSVFFIVEREMVIFFFMMAGWKINELEVYHVHKVYNYLGNT